MCKLAKVSRSGYYNYLKTKVVVSRHEIDDYYNFLLIKLAYNFKNRHKGARMIKMVLEKHYKVIMNLKMIRRLMKKYNLVCPIRKANPYKRMSKAMATNSISRNILNRQFNSSIPGKYLLTDITYIRIMNSKFAYLSTIKDSATKEIVAYKLSKTLDVRFVIDTLAMLEENNNITITSETLVHSDQGCHYTSKGFREKLKDMNITQSMSRRGNCWDNAPQESFFGHMKDELNVQDNITFQELENEIDEYMDYYNNYRYIWTMNKMCPSEYRDYLNTIKGDDNLVSSPN